MQKRRSFYITTAPDSQTEAYAEGLPWEVPYQMLDCYEVEETSHNDEIGCTVHAAHHAEAKEDLESVYTHT